MSSFAADRSPEARKRLILLACVAGSAVVFIDGTVVNVALPAIEDDLGGGLAGQQWTVNAYLLALGSLLLIGGSLGDLVGERRVFALGVGGFGVTSVLCGLAPSIELLVAGRALQGVFGALLVPSALAVIVAAFPAAERGAAIGAWTAYTGVATVFGPIVGGQLVDAASWRWIFLINVPFVIATLVLVAIVVPGRRADAGAGRLDLVGAALCALGLAGPVFALIEQPTRGWEDPAVWVPLAAGLALFGAFLAYERRARAPMLPLGLFARRNFAVGNVESLALYAGLSGFLVFLVLFLQQVAGYTALDAGLATLPVTVVMFLLSRRFGALADRFGPRLFMGAGPLVAAGGLLLLLRIDRDVSYAADLLPALALFALGLAMTVAPLTAAVLAGVEEAHAGIASGVNNAVSRVAGLVGVAAIGAIVAATAAARIDDRMAGASPAALAVAEEAKRRPLGGARLDGVPARERARVQAALTGAAEDGFRAGMASAALLLALGGIAGAAGIANPRREVSACDCEGGALVGAPADLGRDWAAADPVPALTR